MVDGYKLKLKIFLVFLLVLVLSQLKSIFFWCNQLGFNPSLFGTALIIGYLLIITGYVMNRFWGYIAGIIVFSIILLEFYLRAILGFAAFQLSASVLFLNIIINLPSILLTTFVHGVFLLYIISTKNYFKGTEPTEKPFHKIMFILLVIAFFGLLLILYQGEQQSAIACSGDYTYVGYERFATPENALITDWEAYYNRDAEIFIEMAHFSDNLKRKLQLAGIEYSDHLEKQKEIAELAPLLDIDRIEITNKEIINENEVYLEYTIYFQKVEGSAVNAPKNDFAYMIKVDDKWKVNVEPDFEEQFKQMGIS